MIQIKMFSARNGDAFLLKLSGLTQVAILIDAGYASTFEQVILPELKSLHAAGQILDLVIASHIDTDHIHGLIKFFTLNGSSNLSQVIKVKNVWHNSLRSIPFQRSLKELSKQDKQIIKGLARIGFPKPSGTSLLANEISGQQGSSLAALLLAGNYHWNNCDGKQSITSDTPSIRLSEDVNIKVIGPQRKRLESLRKSWLLELERKGFLGEVTQDQYFDDAFEFLNAKENNSLNIREISYSNLDDLELASIYEADSSLNNGSSITILIESNSKKLLFLGDAWAEDVIDSLRNKFSSTQPIYFDVVKISHHGSIRNTSPELLALIDSPRYLISSDGSKHSHPDYPVLKAIVERPSSFVRHLHFNYSTHASRLLKSYKTKSGAQFCIHEESTDWIRVD